MKMGYILIPIVTGCLVLSGCSSDKFAEGAKKTEVKNQEMKKEKKQNEVKKAEKQKKFYESKERPLEEVVTENNLDQVRLMDTITYEPKDEYENGSEFAKYVGAVLYQFYTLQISPGKYYEFLKQYGSADSLKKMPSDKDAVTIISSIQEMFRKQNITGDNYVLSEVVYDRFKREGRFYRRVSTTNGEEYYITTIVKEKGKWKFDQDSPSPPFTIPDDTTSVTDKNSN